jgi:predicted phosphodiesterase
MGQNWPVRVAALYDIHGNLPACEAVLREVRDAAVDAIVVGGDVIPGPMPRELLDCLLALQIPTRFIVGNGELAVLAQVGADEPSDVTYWGTSSGKPLPEAVRQQVRWTAQQIHPDYDSVLRNWPKTLRLTIPGCGDVLFCHGTPRSETGCFTRLTPEERLLPIFDSLDVSLVVCGHTHMQFDRRVGTVRVVNAGSVGMPFGNPGANWLLLGPEVELRQTSYDLVAAAERIRTTAYPGAQEFAAHNVLQVPSEEQMLRVFTDAPLK